MKTVLIVDDEEDIAETLQSYLELKGYCVILAFDGREALARTEETKPDLVVTDMMMPRMDGGELIRRLRSHPATASIPVIAMSANRQEMKVPFFQKPFSPAELVRKIERLLSDESEAHRD